MALLLKTTGHPDSTIVRPHRRATSHARSHTSSRRKRVASFFVDHPRTVDETYLEHAKVASHFAKECALAAVAASVHAVFPAMCCTSASTRIKKVCEEMIGRVDEGCDDWSD